MGSKDKNTEKTKGVTVGGKHYGGKTVTATGGKTVIAAGRKVRSDKPIKVTENRDGTGASYTSDGDLHFD
ncbi:hypothetical protein [Planobispora rosea]|nr:hypothetical protein [Planobispora rosea]